MSNYIETLRKSVGHAPVLQCGACVICINEKSEVLLVKRSDNSCWGFPGGSVELDETVEETAKRELFEETGLTAKSLELFGVYSGKDMHYVYPNGDEVSNVDHVYICCDFSGELNPQQSEVSELCFYSINELPDNISPPQRRPLNDYVSCSKKKKKTIIDTYDEDREAIILPKYVADFEGSVKKLPDIAVANWSGQTIPIAIEQYGAVKTDRFIAGMEYSVYTLEYKGKQITYYFTPVGGASSAAILEEMIGKGVRKIVFYGACGVLDKDLTAKSLIIPTAAYRDEGTSYHYAAPGTYINIPTAPKLAKIFDQLKLPYVQGKTWTTDAFYRETRRNMEDRKTDGCITVEMECASIMSVAQFRGIDCYQFIYAADSLDGVEWDARTLGSLTDDARENFLKIALEVAIRI